MNEERDEREKMSRNEYVRRELRFRFENLYLSVRSLFLHCITLLDFSLIVDDEIKQLTTSHEFHDDPNVSRGLENVHDLDQVFMFQSHGYLDLINHTF